ncbi:hypothetical protein Tsubulata_018780 [Turnera subulata]|uniref:Inhibitor I9 domain-containing protein n=1 Tax=Turnera subulata TaxID=218843 RepID=A0A9Q0JAD5_9ROSI|nr:hypothetical protein Tsubulata_018780 [Turnera subulata]
MKHTTMLFIQFLSLLIIIASVDGLMSNSSSSHASTRQHKHYIVYMGKCLSLDAEVAIQANHEMLSSYVGSVVEARNRIVHHYHKSFRGFSAMLTPKEVSELKKHDQVVSAFKSPIYTLQTTRSWQFLTENSKGYFSGLFDRASQTKNVDVIIGHFDSGIWPESPSFQPRDLGDVPRYFRGECVPGDSFTPASCSRKIVGARYYYQGYERSIGPLERNGGLFFRSARDDYGHGTHTASTAAGTFVGGIQYEDKSGLMARGGGVNARLAVYKVTWFDTCDGSDVLKAFDDAIHDNVDVITMSLGGRGPVSYFEDPFSIGSFHAYENGILVVAAGGNYGLQGSGTICNTAPWVITVAASSVDREFVSTIQLGNGGAVVGYGLNPSGHNDFVPLIFGSEAAVAGSSVDLANQCNYQEVTYDASVVRGKIVVCVSKEASFQDDSWSKANFLAQGGAVGMILIDTTADFNLVYQVSIPTCRIGPDQAAILRNYMQSTRAGSRIAKISGTFTTSGTKPAPVMAPFSGKGPNMLTPDLIKPDIAAPGSNIIASYPVLDRSIRADAYYFFTDSGTSMAAPHVAGVAAVIKAFNRNWSPAAIKSALMTSAISVDNTGHPIQDAGGKQATPYDFGSGQLNPDHAISPGLIYDFTVDDVIDFLCYHASNANQVAIMARGVVKCSKQPPFPFQLNYPSMSLLHLDTYMELQRTLTLAQEDTTNQIYKSVVTNYYGNVHVDVYPRVLDFSTGTRRQTYTVKFTPLAPGFATGDITWSNNLGQVVKTPFVVNAFG